MPRNRTHYVPAFTRRDAEGREQTICGHFVTPEDVAKAGEEITCWGCAMYVANLDVIAPEPARVLARITPDTPWGEPLEAA